MKKYFPILISIIIFAGFLASQVVFDINDTSARQTEKEKQVYSHYESVFKKTKLTGTDGKVYELSKVKAPIIVLNFWASWCTPCLEEFPNLVKMKAQFKDTDVKVFAVNSDDTETMKKITKTSKKFKFNFPVILDKKGKVLDDYMVSAIPVSIIFHKGKVIEVSQGAKDFFSEETLSTFRKLLKI